MTYDEYKATGGSDQEWREFIEDLDQEVMDSTNWDE